MSTDATYQERETIAAITGRAIGLYRDYGIECDPLALSLAILATHANGCRLRLAALLAADDLNFLHDVSGIVNNIDTDTGRLLNCFRPRFAGGES
jgi:hypothetical protein